jgi:hypothetical protein
MACRIVLRPFCVLFLRLTFRGFVQGVLGKGPTVVGECCLLQLRLWIDQHVNEHSACMLLRKCAILRF